MNYINQAPTAPAPTQYAPQQQQQYTPQQPAYAPQQQGYAPHQQQYAPQQQQYAPQQQSYTPGSLSGYQGTPVGQPMYMQGSLQGPGYGGGQGYGGSLVQSALSQPLLDPVQGFGNPAYFIQQAEMEERKKMGYPPQGQYPQQGGQYPPQQGYQPQAPQHAPQGLPYNSVNQYGQIVSPTQPPSYAQPPSAPQAPVAPTYTPAQTPANYVQNPNYQTQPAPQGYASQPAQNQGAYTPVTSHPYAPATYTTPGYNAPSGSTGPTYPQNAPYATVPNAPAANYPQQPAPQHYSQPAQNYNANKPHTEYPPINPASFKTKEELGNYMMTLAQQFLNKELPLVNSTNATSVTTTSNGVVQNDLFDLDGSLIVSSASKGENASIEATVFW